MSEDALFAPYHLMVSFMWMTITPRKDEFFRLAGKSPTYTTICPPIGLAKLHFRRAVRVAGGYVRHIDEADGSIAVVDADGGGLTLNCGVNGISKYGC